MSNVDGCDEGEGEGQGVEYNGDDDVWCTAKDRHMASDDATTDDQCGDPNTLAITRGQSGACSVRGLATACN